MGQLNWDQEKKNIVQGELTCTTRKTQTQEIIRAAVTAQEECGAPKKHHNLAANNQGNWPQKLMKG